MKLQKTTTIFDAFSSFDSSRMISGMMLLLATITTTVSTTGCLTGAAMREAAVLPVGQVEVMAGANVIGMVQDDVATTVVIPDVSARIGVANHTDIQLRSAGSASVYYQMFGEPTSRSDIDVTVGAGVYVPTLTWLAPSPSSLPLAIPVQAMVDLPVGHDVTVNVGASIFPVFETSLLGNKLDDNGNALPLVKDFKLTPAITAGVTWYLGNLSLQPAISWGMDDPFGLSSTSSNSKAQAVSGTISVGYVFGR